MPVTTHYETLREYRMQHLGFTLKQLAETGRCTEAHLCAIENGYLHRWPKHRARFANLYRLPLAEYERLVKAGGK